MTLGALGTVASVAIFIAGVVYFGRKRDGRTRVVGIVATVIVTVLVGWLAWYVGVSPSRA